MKILTFDIEDWFHILDNDTTRAVTDWKNFESRAEAGTDRILNLLQRKKIKASFFVLGWIAEKYPQIVKKIHSCGYEIGSHSYAHQLAYEQTREEFRDDLLKSLSLLEAIIGYRPEIYRVPGFSLRTDSLWVLDELISAGIKIDCSVFPAPRAHGGLTQYAECVPGTIQNATGSVKCFPMTTHSLAGRQLVLTGGGYFRLFPYPLIRHALARGGYVMTYFHPRDFDAGQPMIPGLSAIRRFKSYTGIKGALQKLDRMIDDFEFTDLKSAASHIDWKTAPQYLLDNGKLTHCKTGAL